MARGTGDTDRYRESARAEGRGERGEEYRGPGSGRDPLEEELWGDPSKMGNRKLATYMLYRQGQELYGDARDFADAGHEVTPEEYAALLDADSYLLDRPEAAGVHADRRAIDSQRRALQGLEQMATGMPNEGDLAAQNMLRMQQAEQARGQRGALQNRFAAQGMGGSGAELASQLSAQQGGMNAMALQQGMLDQERSRRALAAMQAAGSQASGMRGQSFGEGMARAQAADIFNQDNMNWRRGAAMATADQANTAFGQLARAQENATAAGGFAMGAGDAALDWAIGKRERKDKQEERRNKLIKKYTVDIAGLSD